MKHSIKSIRIGMIFIIPVLLLTMNLSAQDNKAYDEAKLEIEQMFGTFPTMFDVYPENALPAAWNNFKALHGPDNVIPPKYRELLQLAVASQIPCDYCIYFHTASAKAHGATDAEIQEAIAQGAQTRHWSMVIQGNQVDFEEFKKEFDAMMEHMAANAEK